MRDFAWYVYSITYYILRRPLIQQYFARVTPLLDIGLPKLVFTRKERKNPKPRPPTGLRIPWSNLAWNLLVRPLSMAELTKHGPSQSNMQACSPCQGIFLEQEFISVGMLK